MIIQVVLIVLEVTHDLALVVNFETELCRRLFHLIRITAHITSLLGSADSDSDSSSGRGLDTGN